MKNIAIIGSGLSGLTVANLLKGKANISVFEKSRGVSGRLATRYADPYKFDHGAQFFTAKTPEFQEFIQPMIDCGVIQRWDASFAEYVGNKLSWTNDWSKIDPHYVGCPNMNSVGKYLSKDIDVKLQTKITNITGNAGNWNLLDEKNNEYGFFDIVILAIPILQALDLLPKCSFLPEIQNLKMQGCFSLMLGFEQPLDLKFDSALVREADISWMSVNSSKPQRSDDYSFIALSTNQWAEIHMEEDSNWVKDHLLAQASWVLGKRLDHATHIDLHCWRYANISKQHLNHPFYDKELGIGTCGDWCIQGRVESSFLSAKSLVEYLN